MEPNIETLFPGLGPGFIRREKRQVVGLLSIAYAKQNSLFN